MPKAKAIANDKTSDEDKIYVYIGTNTNTHIYLSKVLLQLLKSSGRIGNEWLL